MIYLNIVGQLKSGKNGMRTTREGHHYPNKIWEAWRDDVVAQIKRQFFASVITRPCSVIVWYWKGDSARRDVPGMEDALWHCLERAGVVADDKLFATVRWCDKGLDRQFPRAVIGIQEVAHALA